MDINLVENEIMVSLTKYKALEAVLDQVRWERDMAIKQLEDHNLSFMAIQQPLTLKKLETIRDDVPVYMEMRGCKHLSSNWGWYAKEYCKDCDSNYYNRLDYGRSYRYWLGCKPTDEERARAEWDDRSDKEKCDEI